MMNSRMDMFKEVRGELLKVLLLNNLLNASIVFLALTLILRILSIPYIIPLTISIIYLILVMFIGIRKISMKYVEEKNPNLKEMLRTAYDNREIKNIVVDALFNDVIGAISKISSGTFIDFKKFFTKVGAIFILAMVLVALGFFNINISVVGNPLQKPISTIENFFKGLTGIGVNETNLEMLDEDMYGQPRMAKLSIEETNIEITPTLSALNFQDVEEADPEDKNIKDYPGEAVAKESEACLDCGIEDINERKTAAEYSETINRR